MKRILLSLAFVAALAAGGLGLSSAAEAYGGCGYGSYGYSSNYYPSYYGGYGYAPQVSYYRDYGHRGHGHRRYHGHHDYHGHGHSGLHFSIGF
jgi:hypothetical protein